MVSFHTGAAETMAKVRLLESDGVPPGKSTWAQLLLDRPVALVNGDHFIIRSSTETLGGGTVVESHARRLRRFRPAVLENLRAKEEGTAEERILALLERPLEMSVLLSQANRPVDEVRSAIESLIQQGKLLRVGYGEDSLLITAPDWERLSQRATALLQDYHQKFPTRSGILKVALGSRLGLGEYSTAVWRRLFEQGIIVDNGVVVHLPAHQIRLTPAQQAKIDVFLRSLKANPYAPPTELIPEPDLLNLLIAQRQVVKVSDHVVFATSAYQEMVSKVTAYIKTHGKVSLAEVRDMFQTSRKYAQAFLEYLDGEKITRRAGDERVLY